MQWIESVPNFSEGKDPQVLTALVKAAEPCGVTVLGMDADGDHNRSVLTLAGTADAVIAALLATARVAVEHIDLRCHRGVHPRIGAVDVIPLIPMGDTPMATVIDVSREVGRRLGEDLGLPVYLYDRSATKARHRQLADVRRGGFSRLTGRLSDDPPDYGPPRPHPTAGAVAVGARLPLIAFNCYLATADVGIARRIAATVRGSGGGLAGVKALGLDTVAQAGAVQVSMNLVDYPQTPLPVVVEMVRREAARWGTTVVRTELVGKMPLTALFDTASYYLQLPALQEMDVVELNLLSAELRHVRLP